MRRWRAISGIETPGNLVEVITNRGQFGEGFSVQCMGLAGFDFAVQQHQAGVFGQGHGNTGGNLLDVCLFGRCHTNRNPVTLPVIERLSRSGHNRVHNVLMVKRECAGQGDATGDEIPLAEKCFCANKNLSRYPLDSRRLYRKLQDSFQHGSGELSIFSETGHETAFSFHGFGIGVFFMAFGGS